MMPTKFLASFLLLVASAAAQNTIDLAGGLKAQVVSMARARDTLNIAVKISNESKDRMSAFILLFGEPSAFNDGGAKYRARPVAGAAYCPGFANNPRICVGFPSDQYLFPLQQYTEIEPGKLINVHFQFLNGDDKGQTISLTQEISFQGDKYKFSARLTVINLTNKEALYNYLSTFSGTHYISPRAITATIGFHF
jgi:hypothetical protein